MSEAGPVVYDPVELRRRIAVCFSVSELKELADALGVGGIPWDRGLQEAAREVVRQCERYAGLPALVARLREARPEMEWPEPAVGDGLPGAGTARLPVVPAPLPPTIGFPAPPALSASPGTLAPPGAVLVDPYQAGSAGGPAGAPPPPPAPIPATSVAAPPLAGTPPRPAGWVFNEGAAAQGAGSTPSSGIDPRILIAVAGLMVVAAVIAYLAGRASSASAGSDTAPAAAASSAGATRGDGPAVAAADAIARSLANVARACELPSSAGSNVAVFRRVFERCGPAPPQPRRSHAPSPAATTPPETDPAPGDARERPPTDPTPPRSRRPGRDAPPVDPQPASKGCMGACDTTHAACRTHCGLEPTESSAYDGYQRCLGRCLSDASRCRMSCR